MNNRFKNILLICSLIFNITLISLIIYRSAAESPQSQPPRRLEREHKEQYKEKRGRISEMRSEFIETRRDFIAMLSSPDIDEQELQSSLSKVIDKQTEMEKMIGSHLIEMRLEMTAEEAEDFFERLIRRHKSRPDAQRRNAR